MKRFYTFFLSALLIAASADAQTVQIGTGTLVPANTLYSPIYRFGATSTTTHGRSNILFTQAELAAAGILPGSTITAIAFNKTNAATFLIPATLNVYMGNTNNTSLATTLTWASVLTTHIQVFSSTSYTMPGTSGWVTINVNPFTYTGNSLEIATEYQQTGGSSGANGPFQWEYTAGTATMAVGNVGTSFPATLSGSVAAYKHRPNIRITYIGSTACTDPPTPGDATATPSLNICPGTQVTLNLANNSTGTGQTYQWESSPNNTTYTPFGTAQVSPSTTVTPTSTTWYRAAVTCGSTTLYSTPVQVTVQPQLAGNYTINSAQTTGGTNFQSFNDFASAIHCAGVSGPVVVDVVSGSGPYNEQVTFNQILGASATNTITINGHGQTLTYSSSTSAERAGIKFNGTDYFTIDSLNVTGTGTYAWAIQFLSGSSSNTISNCTITVPANSTSTNYFGIIASGSATSYTTVAVDCDSNTFSGNTVIGGYAGIRLMGNGTTDRFIYNRLLNNTVQEFYSYGIYMDAHDGVLIEGNDVSRPTRTTNLSAFYGVYFTDVINGRISKNRIHDPAGAVPTNTSSAYGVYFTASDATSADANIVSNNAIYDFNHMGALYGLYNSGSDYARYYHNTISFDNTTSTATSVAYGFYQTTLASNIDLRNNIITITRGGTGTKRTIHLATAGTSSTFTSNRNVLYIGSTAGTNEIAYDIPNSYVTLADWQVAGFDVASQSIDPLYTNIGTADFTPTEPSINNLGQAVGITTDILNTTRNPVNPDPGAFEFGLPPCIDPPTPGDAVASATTVCAGAPVSLNLTNNSSGDNQTYQWQTSPNNTTYTNVGTPQVASSFLHNPTSTIWYRAAVTCGTTTLYSTPVQVMVNQPLSGNYTINSAMVTSGTNFQTFNDFEDALACGISGPVVATVVAGSGPYNEQVVFGEIAGASATNTITINGNNETLTFNSTTSADRSGIRLDGTDHMTINNLTITPTGTYGWGIHLFSGSANNTINGCTLNIPATATTTNFAGIVASGSYTSGTTAGNDCDSNIFSNNNITGGYYGIILYGNGTTNRFVRNVVSNNTITDFYYSGVYTDSHDGLLVEGNDMSRPNRTASPTTVYCLYYSDLINSRITRNRIHNPMDSDLASTDDVNGIYCTTSDATAATANIISNNLVYNINNGGAQYGIHNIGSDHNYYYHNTISLDHVTSTATELTRGFYQTTAATGIQFINNIVTIGRGGTGVKTGVYLNTTTSTVTTNYNDIYVWATGGTLNIGSIGTTGYTTLTAWQGVGRDLNSVTIDPLYTNIGLGDFTPTEPTLDNLGTPVGVFNDINNANRSATNPDMGAYEFLTVPCADPTGLAANNITGSTADLSWDAINMIPGYEYQVDQSPTPPTGNGTFTNTNTYNATGLTQSSQYYLHVRIFCGNGNYSQWVTLPFETACPNAVAIVTVNGNDTLCQGDSVILSAQTDPNYTYQWRLNGVDIPGATDSVFAATTSGNYRVRVTNGVGCTTTSNPATSITVHPAPPAVISGSTSICFSGSVTLSAGSGSGITYQWQENGVDIPGATTNTYSTSDSGSFTVRTTYTSTGCSALSAPANVVINTPTVTSTTDSFNCGPGSVTLQATGNTGSTLTWYDVPGGTVLGTGNTFTTPVIGTTTDFYVTAGIGNTIGNVGPVNPAAVGTTGGGTAVTTYYMIFDVLVPTTLVSVDVFPTGTVGSNASIVILDNTNTVLYTIPYTTAVTGGSTPQTVMLNVPMNPGTGYRMRQGTTTGLYRNTGGAVFPYTSSAINITGHNFTTASYYYYFYNWQFTTGCESAPVAVTANINPVPNATATTSDPTTVCTGDLVNMMGTAGTGYTYQWLNNGLPINGADSILHIVNVVGSYSVIVTDGPCADTSAAINVTVNTPPASNIYPAGPTTICQGNSVVLNANTGTGLSYQWQLNGVDIAGATNSSFTATAAGDYTVTVSNGTSTNCSLTSPVVTVTVVPGPTATITPGGPTSVCAGEAVELAANTGTGLTHQWQLNGVNIPNVFSSTYNATTSGSYTVQVSNGSCTVTSAPVNVTVFPALNPVATLSGNVLSTGVFNAYQWYQNNLMIPGATSQSFTAVNSGVYFVVVTDANGCSDTSNAINYFSTSVGFVSGADEVSIYPNPTTSRVYIKAPVKVDVVVTAVDGKLIAEKEDAEFVDLGDVAAGVYQIRVTNKEGKLLKVEKLLKSEK